jgi:hypothetical protein
MSHTIRDLHALTEDEVIRLHDQKASDTFVGVDYYLNELRRREQVAVMRSSEALARASFRLTVANTILAAVATVAAVIALIN